MIFKQVDEIISGAKTQTRRVVKPGEELHYDYDGRAVMQLLPMPMPPAYKPRYRTKWQVGRDYAVVSKRGTRGVMWRPDTGKWYVPESTEDVRDGYVPLRVRVTDIRQEPLQNISETDALAEGVDINLGGGVRGVLSPVTAYRNLWDSINDRAGVRWHDNPQVWVITFEVVR